MSDFTTISLNVAGISAPAGRGRDAVPAAMQGVVTHDRQAFADRMQVVWRDNAARPGDPILDGREIGARLLDEYDRTAQLRLYVLAVGILFNAPYPLAGSAASYAAPSTGLTNDNAGRIVLGGWVHNAAVIAQIRRVTFPKDEVSRGFGITPLSLWKDCSMKIVAAGPSPTFETDSTTFPADTESGDLLELRVLAQQIDPGDGVEDGHFGELAVWFPRLSAVKSP